MKKYDLENRTLEFSQKIIHLSKKLPVDRINNRLIDQLVRSATPLGAN